MELIERINTMLTDRFGEFGPLLAVGILGMFLILLTLPVLLRKQHDPLDKLREASRQAQAAEVKGPKGALRSTKRDKLERYSNFLEPQDEEEYSAVRLKLMQAGYRSKNAVRTYHFMQFALGIGFLLVERRRNLAVTDRERRDGRFESAGGPQQVPRSRLG